MNWKDWSHGTSQRDDAPEPIKPKKERRMVEIEVVGPISTGYCECRTCGGTPFRFHIVGLSVDDANFWECPDCKVSEVVKGTPMQFGELPFYEPAVLLKRYNEYRQKAGLPPLDR